MAISSTRAGTSGGVMVVSTGVTLCSSSLTCIVGRAGRKRQAFKTETGAYCRLPTLHKSRRDAGLRYYAPEIATRRGPELLHLAARKCPASLCRPEHETGLGLDPHELAMHLADTHAGQGAPETESLEVAAQPRAGALAGWRGECASLNASRRTLPVAIPGHSWRQASRRWRADDEGLHWVPHQHRVAVPSEIPNAFNGKVC
jgi:hypothetical protein